MSGTGRNSLQQLFPHAHLPPSCTERGWWGKGRETHRDALKRAKVVSEWLWELAILNESDTHKRNGGILIITHGKFQDLLIKCLLQRNGGLPYNEKSDRRVTPSHEDDDPYFEDDPFYFVASNASISLLDLKITDNHQQVLGIIWWNAVAFLKADSRAGKSLGDFLL